MRALGLSVSVLGPGATSSAEVDSHIHSSKYGDVFRIPSFKFFWLGFTFSGLGDAMTRTVLVWMVYSLTGSSEALGLLLVFYAGPVVVGGLMAGSLLDRFDRRVVIISDNVIRGVAMAVIPVLGALNLLSLSVIYAVAAIYGFFFMITLAGGPSIMPDLVPENGLAAANSLETLSFTLSGVIGPPIAGFLIPAVGAPNVIVIDVVSYAVFALSMTKVALPRRMESPGAAQTQGRGYRIANVLRLFAFNRVLLSTTLMFMAFNFGGGFLSVWLPILSADVLHGGSALYGTMLGLTALGEVIGAVLGGNLVSYRLSLGRLICTAQLLAGASLIPLLVGVSLWTAGLSLFLLGAFSSPLTIWAQTLRMKVIPAQIRGRTFALLRTMMQGAGPTGSAAAGFLFPAVGFLAIVAASAGLIGVPGLLGFGVKDLARERSMGGAET